MRDYDTYELQRVPTVSSLECVTGHQHSRVSNRGSDNEKSREET